MSRFAVYLFFVAILLNGVEKSLQGNDTSSEAEKKDGDDTKTEPPITESPKTELPKTESPKTESPKTESPKTEPPKAELKSEEVKNTEEPKESKDVKITESKKEKSKSETRRASIEELNPLNNNFEESFLGPVLQVRAKIGEAVHKGVDSAKGIADGAYKLLKGAVTRIL